MAGLHRIHHLEVVVLVGLAACACLSTTGYAQPGAETFGRDVYWNATPNDVNNLLSGMRDAAGADFRMDIRRVSEISSDPDQNPVLYRSGHYRFAFTPEERQLLREYMLNGGMMIFNTGLGSLPFYRSVTNELAMIFPEQPLQRLTADHPIFHSFYDVSSVEYAPGVYSETSFRGDQPWFEGIEINCRIVALVSRWCLAVGWQGEVDESYQAYMPDSAFELGVNILTYATSMRAWAQNAAHAMQFENLAETASDHFTMGHIIYDGVWKTRHAGLSTLLHAFNQRTGIPVQFGLRELRLTDPNLPRFPVLYMTGHEHFTLQDAELQALRRYLEAGGLLFAEACCGRRGFDQAFRQMVRRLFPDRSLQQLPEDHVLFSAPNDVSWMGVTPVLMERLGMASIPPRVEALVHADNVAIVYSPFGLAGGWELSPSPYANAYNPASSTQLGENILMYSITH